jgi:hypothetical protein
MGKFTVDGVAAGGNQVVVIRSEGTASDGRTTVVLEMTMGGRGEQWHDPGRGWHRGGAVQLGQERLRRQQLRAEQRRRQQLKW